MVVKSTTGEPDGGLDTHVRQRAKAGRRRLRPSCIGGRVRFREASWIYGRNLSRRLLGRQCEVPKGERNAFTEHMHMKLHGSKVLATLPSTALGNQALEVFYLNRQIDKATIRV